jgi:hypothetical protein
VFADAGVLGGVAVGFELPEPGGLVENGGDDDEDTGVDEEIGEGRVVEQGGAGDAVARARLARTLVGVEIGLVELVADFGEFVFGEETGQDGDAV